MPSPLMLQLHVLNRVLEECLEMRDDPNLPLYLEADDVVLLKDSQIVPEELRRLFKDRARREGKWARFNPDDGERVRDVCRRLRQDTPDDEEEEGVWHP